MIGVENTDLAVKCADAFLWLLACVCTKQILTSEKFPQLNYPAH